MRTIFVPVSFGDLLDKITILQIKAERLSDPQQVANVRAELAALVVAWEAHLASGVDVAGLQADLLAVNRRLWDIEEGTRTMERAGTFGPEFVELARSVYRENDTRARIKRAINLALGSAYVEEKSHAGVG